MTDSWIVARTNSSHEQSGVVHKRRFSQLAVADCGGEDDLLERDWTTSARLTPKLGILKRPNAS
jgi:hypothetical protein